MTTSMTSCQAVISVFDISDFLNHICYLISVILSLFYHFYPPMISFNKLAKLLQGWSKHSLNRC